MERYCRVSVSTRRCLTPPGTCWPRLPAVTISTRPWWRWWRPAATRLRGYRRNVAIATTSAVFTAVLILAVYDLGKSIGEPAGGRAGRPGGGHYPATFGSRDALDIDLALTAQAAIFMALLVRSRGLRPCAAGPRRGGGGVLSCSPSGPFPCSLGGPAALHAVAGLARGGRTGGGWRGPTWGWPACCLLVAATWWAYKWRYDPVSTISSGPPPGPSEGDRSYSSSRSGRSTTISSSS
jgi:hypothetical protein